MSVMTIDMVAVMIEAMSAIVTIDIFMDSSMTIYTAKVVEIALEAPLGDQALVQKKISLAILEPLSHYRLGLSFQTETVSIAFKRKNQTISVQRIIIQDKYRPSE